MKKNVIFFEAEGGSDKGEDGHRRDTLPMITALRARGWRAESLFYTDQKKNEIFEYVVKNFDAYVSRINPGNIPGGEATYFELLRALSDAGVIGMPNPDVMIGYGAKDALTKLTDTNLVPEDTYAYYNLNELREKFAINLSRGERVLKQNRGSTGEGIWRVTVIDERNFDVGKTLPADTQIKATEAVDNHVEFYQLGKFIEFCNQYLLGENGMLVDMPFMPRIKEGEIRILLVGDTPIFVVHKKPVDAEDAFSATLFSGAKYRYDKPEKWDILISLFLSNIPLITNKLGGYALPLIWTADFMLDTGEDGHDKYVLGEMNCSCVGFTSHLNDGIQEIIADKIIQIVSEEKGEK